MKTILLVEDEALIAIDQTKTLKDFGFNVITVSSSEKAIEFVSKEVDLILMDVNLGNGSDGVETAKKIHETKNVPIAFLTSHSNIDRIKGVIHYGLVPKNNLNKSILESIFEQIDLRSAVENKCENKWEQLFDILPVGISIVNSDRVIIESNQRLKQILDVTEEGLKNKIYSQRKYFDSNNVEMTIDKFPSIVAIKEQKIVRNVEIKIEKENGDVIWAAVSASPLSDKTAVIVTRDITELKQKEAEILKNQRYTRSLIEASLDSLFTFDVDRKITDVNSATERIASADRSKLIGRDFIELFNDPEKAKLIHLKAFEEGSLANLSLKMNDTEVICNASVLEGEKKVFVAARDITIIKEKELEIENLLKEKELLLREVHHRVKNNMNIAISLLSLQATNTKDLFVSTTLKSAANRLRSMSILYDKLYRSTDDFKNVSVRKYFISLISEIHSSFNSKSKIEILIEEDFIIDTQKILTVGIILNELITNAVKYAFLKKPGTITVSMSKIKNVVNIVVEDNGCGASKDISGFGIELVKTLVDQLEGSIEIQSKNGMKFIINFEV